jgi:phenylacetate 2-hydroxylase
MVSAGLDTVPGNLIMGVAHLSSAHDGPEIQQRAYEEIMKVYPDGDAWEQCIVEEKVPFITALVREVLRFYTVIPICLPRTSIKDIKYEDAVIPAGTTFYMVSISILITGKKVTFSLLTPTPRTLGLPISTPPTSRTRKPSA